MPLLHKTMRTVARRCCCFLLFPLVLTLFSMCFSPRVHADGGAPNLAYVSGTPSGVSVNHKLWVTQLDALTVFNGLTEQQIGKIPIPDGPESVSLPPGETAYVSTRRGTVDAVDIRTRAVYQLLTGGVFGPMDYDALT